jgi:hypothetical protein
MLPGGPSGNPERRSYRPDDTAVRSRKSGTYFPNAVLPSGCGPRPGSSSGPRQLKLPSANIGQHGAVRFRLTISDPCELTSEDGPTCLVGDGVPNDAGFVRHLDPGSVLGGVPVSQAHLCLRHKGVSFSWMRAGDYPPVNGTATGSGQQIRFIASIRPE